jgi:hypothetical protein
MNDPQQRALQSPDQQMQTAQAWAEILARPGMVFTRFGAGERWLGVMNLLRSFGAVLIVALLASPSGGAEEMTAFAFVFLFKGLSELRKSRTERKRGNLQHSRFIGDTKLEKLTCFPEWLRKERRLSRHVEPLAYITVGLLLMPLFTALPMFIILMGFCIRAMEARLRKQELEQELDAVDSLIECNVVAKKVEHFTTTGPNGTQQATRVTVISTGMSDELRDRMKRKSYGNHPQ